MLKANERVGGGQGSRGKVGNYSRDSAVQSHIWSPSTPLSNDINFTSCTFAWLYVHILRFYKFIRYHVWKHKTSWHWKYRRKIIWKTFLPSRPKLNIFTMLTQRREFDTFSTLVETRNFKVEYAPYGQRWCQFSFFNIKTTMKM